MDRSYYYSFNEYESRPILDEKFHLIRRLTALILCTVFLFPYVYYNLPYLSLLPSDDSYLNVSEDAEFNYIKSGTGRAPVINGHLKSGELYIYPNLSQSKSYRFLITTRNTVISSKDAILNIFCYQGTDGIYYTHLVCQKGHAVVNLYNEKESKVSSFGKYISQGYEALIYEDEAQNKTGFVRFESDGSNPRADHGVYTREIKTIGNLYEYLELDPLYYSVFISSGFYSAPIWSYSLSTESQAKTIGSVLSTDPQDFTVCSHTLYFSKYVPWGEEDTLITDDSEEIKNEATDTPGNNFTPRPVLRNMVINDNMKTLGGRVPLVLDTLTIHENFPSNTLIIMGEIRVNSLILIAANGKDESHLIETDFQNKVHPIRNYFKNSDTGYISIV